MGKDIKEGIQKKDGIFDCNTKFFKDSNKNIIIKNENGLSFKKIIQYLEMLDLLKEKNNLLESFFVNFINQKSEQQNAR